VAYLVIGIDPGSRKTGYGIIAVDGRSLKHVASGVIDVARYTFFDRLKYIYDELLDVVVTYEPNKAAIEEVFVSRNAQSALKLGHARGAAVLALKERINDVHSYSARRVKQSIVGYGAAEKGQIQHMVKLILSVNHDLQEDQADALAVAITHAHHHQTHQVTQGD
jgi:crossover junction endodeoxyribonuclease RuvC